MSSLALGVLTIGQSPRPDLVGAVRRAMPAFSLIEIGALDELTVEQIPSAAGAPYPLITSLADGQRVLVPEEFLVPRLQLKLDELEAQGVAATILLCAGTFAGLHGTRPLVKPFAVGQRLLGALGLGRVGFITPVVGQIQAIEARWKNAGIQPGFPALLPIVWAADLARQDEAFERQLQGQIAAHDLQAIVLDYVGHPPAQVQRLQARTNLPVLDLGALAVAVLAGIVNH